ncbi:MAG: hypothetical protein ACI8VT_004331 [Saprospiraceae bacterium]
MSGKNISAQSDKVLFCHEDTKALKTELPLCPKKYQSIDLKIKIKKRILAKGIFFD